MANIIITGSSRGIGFELVKLFAAEGHKIVALSRNPKPVQDLKLKNVTAFSFDITDTASMAELNVFIRDTFKTVDVIVNNAGKLLCKPFKETSTPEFLDIYQVNVLGVAAIIQQILPYMPKTGHVVNISSMGGVQGSLKFAGLAAYSSSKGALITLTELLAEEYKETGPAFNVLALGAVQTEMLAEAFPGYEAPVTAAAMATYIKDFALSGHQLYNGKLLQVSNSTP